MEKQTRENFSDSKVKSSIRVKLGTYSAAIWPLGIILSSLSVFWALCYHWHRDRRNYSFPLIGNLPIAIGVAIFYILSSMVWGPKFMENRKPIKPKKIMMAYNLVQVIICSYIFLESGFSGWFSDYSWKCEPTDWSRKPKTLRMVFAVYLFYITKLMDYTDTLFLVLGKRWNGISVLHVVHHSAMHLKSFVGTYYIPVTHMNFAVFVNSFIHVLMYSYYFLASLGPSVQPYLWWKKYLTSIQMGQFILVFAHNMQIFFRDCPDAPKEVAIHTGFFALLYLYLFADFYVNEYNQKKAIKKTS